MTNMCSAWAYEEIIQSGSLSERLAMYLSVFVDAHPESMTAREATEMVKEKFGFDFPVSSYVARCSDLSNMGFLKAVDIVRCEISGKRVNKWAYTGRRAPYNSEVMEVECPNCKGRGMVEKKVYLPESTQMDLF